jgi:hypothetical protein
MRTVKIIDDTNKSYDSGTGDDIYSGIATFGVVMSDIKAIMGSFIGIILIVVGIGMIIKKSFRTLTLIGTVKSSNCTEIIDSNNIHYNCDFTVEYNVEGKTQTKSFSNTYSYKKYNVNDIITLWYDPDNTSNIDISSDNLHSLGWGILILGVIIIISSIIWAYLANKYKAVAALQGVLTGVNVIGGRGF